MTALGGGVITLVGQAGTAMMQEPYIYFIAFGLGAGAISMGISLLLKRKGRKKR